MCALQWLMLREMHKWAQACLEIFPSHEEPEGCPRPYGGTHPCQEQQLQVHVSQSVIQHVIRLVS